MIINFLNYFINWQITPYLIGAFTIGTLFQIVKYIFK